MVAGFALFKGGAVELVTAGDDALEARVKSKRLRRVRIRVERGTLAIGCTCAPATMDAPTCKHVWATFLEADRRALLEPLRGAARPLPVARLPMPSELDDPAPASKTPDVTPEGRAPTGKKKTPSPVSAAPEPASPEPPKAAPTKARPKPKSEAPRARSKPTARPKIQAKARPKAMALARPKAPARPPAKRARSA
jgi:hypothetical protein